MYKKYQKMKLKDLDQDAEIVDLRGSDLPDEMKSKLSTVRQIELEPLRRAFQEFAGADLGGNYFEESVPVYEHEDMPGKEVSAIKEIAREHLARSQLLPLGFVGCLIGSVSSLPNRVHHPLPRCLFKLVYATLKFIQFT